MESRPHHHHEGHDASEEVSIRHVKGENNKDFAIRVVAPFSMDDLRALPLDSHVLMLHIDPRTGRALELDGTHWSAERMAEAEEMNPGTDGGQFSGTLMYVAPLSDEDAYVIAQDIIKTIDPKVIDAIRDGKAHISLIAGALMAAAKLGRGVGQGEQDR